MQLSGGDFDGFEVTLADAVFGDANLRQDLAAGTSIHTLMARELYPDKSEAEILLSKGHKDGGDVDMYTRGKQAVFAFLYGGDEKTINKKLSIAMKIAKVAMENLQNKYPGIARSRERVEKMLGALKQTGEVGTRIIWEKCEDKVTSFLGFSRYFTLENRIVKELYDLAGSMPKEFHSDDGYVKRRDRHQTLAGATCSALYGAAFNIQAANIRAANNHLIQSPGAMITKDLQRKIWDHQPSGIGEWVVLPMNVHDEVLVVCLPSVVDDVAQTVVTVVESYRDRVPLIGMEWARDMKSWGEKGKVDLGIKPSGVVDQRDDAYVEPVTLEQMEELDAEPLYVDFESDLSEWI
jgi:DNA polymerase I-like protein with 3'-5' exonuclease and polymerase domains